MVIPGGDARRAVFVMRSAGRSCVLRASTATPQTAHKTDMGLHLDFTEFPLGTAPRTPGQLIAASWTSGLRIPDILGELALSSMLSKNKPEANPLVWMATSMCIHFQ